MCLGQGTGGCWRSRKLNPEFRGWTCSFGARLVPTYYDVLILCIWASYGPATGLDDLARCRAERICII